MGFKVGDIVTEKALEDVRVKGLGKFPYTVTTSEGIFKVIDISNCSNHKTFGDFEGMRVKIISHLDKLDENAQKGKIYAVNDRWFRKITPKGRKAIERYINIDKLSK